MQLLGNKLKTEIIKWFAEKTQFDKKKHFAGDKPYGLHICQLHASPSTQNNF